MSAPPRLDGVALGDPQNPYASQNKWRHQESSDYARYENQRGLDGSGQQAPHQGQDTNGKPHDPSAVAGGAHDGNNGIETQGTANELGSSQVGTQGDASGLEVKCGPLLNYRRMENHTWFGSVLVVTKGGSGDVDSPVVPELALRVQAAGKDTDARQNGAGNDPDNQNSQGHESGSSSTQEGRSNGYREDGAHGVVGAKEAKVKGVKLYSDLSNTFWRFELEVELTEKELRCDYSISSLSFTKGKKNDQQHFFVPALSDSMRIMFHSCNGFSVGTDEDAWSGAALWNDVQRVHSERPFHVMIGGGDQIYNDSIRVSGPLKEWTAIGNPHKRKEFPFPEKLRKDCDTFYANNYVKWYTTEPFAGANGQIPQLNLWDDHDIIDGFGSYVDEFMRCPVFRGIGGVANKYYLLFQHHLAPPRSTYTTDAPQTTGHSEVHEDPRQLENCYVLDEESIDSSYIIGDRPGPYVVEHSRSIYARLGARIAFFGIDARTERTRKQVNYPETYKIIFERLRKELGAAKESSTPVQHLVVLLGIPIAYPRLTWLENIFTSPIIAPIKFLNKRFGFGGGFFNHFDGNIDLLDDLDDHYTARTHKKERLYLVKQLQDLAAEFSVRVSILGGDVHLAAVGRFYSNPKLNVPIQEDHRYMANIISSAIVNKPPPSAVANLLARRNKLHHLDHDTDETLMNFFDKDPGESSKTSGSNKVTMPSRNWAMITENSSHVSHSLTNGNTEGQGNDPEQEIHSLKEAKDGHSWLHSGESDAGSKHKAADSRKHGSGTDGSLDVAIRVEKDQHDSEGNTTAYGLTIPRLVYGNAAEHHLRKRDAFKRHH